MAEDWLEFINITSSLQFLLATVIKYQHTFEGYQLNSYTPGNASAKLPLIFPGCP